jgi:peptide/nickel transport system substrate-binding protein
LILLSISITVAGCQPEPVIETVVVTEVVEGEVVEKIITTTPEPEEEVVGVEAPDTLVILAESTAPDLDPDIWGGIAWERALCNVYEPPFFYEMVSPEEMGTTGVNIDGLVNMKGVGDGGIVGNLFESWEVSEDEQTYTLHIRQPYLSYFGNQATAEDWIYRVERGFALKATGDFQLRVIGLTGPEDVVAIDDYTIQMNLPMGPNPVFFKGLAVPVLFPIDIDVVREEGWITEEDPWAFEGFKHNDYGFGPYHTVDFVPGSYMRFESNPNYWKGEPFFKEVIVREVPEAANRFAMMIAGEGHLARELSITQFAALRDEGGIGEAVYAGLPKSHSSRLVVKGSLSQGTFTNIDCLHALGYAIPYDEILEIAYRGFGQELHEVVVPLYGETVNLGNSPYYYDLEKATELWERGQCASSWTLLFEQEFERLRDVAVLIKTEFAKMGVDVILDMKPAAIVAAQTSARDIEGFIESGAAFVADAGYASWLTYHRDSFMNYQDLQDPEINDLIDQAMAMAASAERTQLLHDLQDLLVDRGGAIPVLVEGHHLACSKHLKGIFIGTTGCTYWGPLIWEP